MRAESENTFRIHLGLFLAELVCVPAFIFEISRALKGNVLSWVYVFEWPLLGSYAVYIWRRMLREEREERLADAALARGEVSPARIAAWRAEEDDPELRAWNEYLAKVHGGQAAGVDTPDA